MGSAVTSSTAGAGVSSTVGAASATVSSATDSWSKVTSWVASVAGASGLTTRVPTGASSSSSMISASKKMISSSKMVFFSIKKLLHP